MTARLPSVTIIVINWNGWQDTVECLRSLAEVQDVGYDVVLVDNGSGDGSVPRLMDFFQNEGREAYDLRIMRMDGLDDLDRAISQESGPREEGKHRVWLVCSGRNAGFAGGNNIGLHLQDSLLRSDYVLLLNNDTVVDPAFLAILCEAGDRDEGIGVLGPLVLSFHDRDRHLVQSAGGIVEWGRGNITVLKFDRPQSSPSDAINHVDYVMGCALLIKREVAEKIGPLDESYFAYWEEVEWCHLAKQLGYGVVVVEKARIWHKGMASTRKVSGFEEYHMTRNRFWFMNRHASRSQFARFLLYFALMGAWAEAGSIMLHDQRRARLSAFLRGTVDGLRRG